MPKNTKIVATISNLNCSEAFIGRLYTAGMNVVRLNTAHMSHVDALEVIGNVRKVSSKIGILLDTKGPEIRTCDAAEPLAVKFGDTVGLRALRASCPMTTSSASPTRTSFTMCRKEARS
jgi:pyruvate kinase